MYRITKEFAFEASHRLDHLPVTHPCSRHHGHSYRVQVHLASEGLDERFFLVDYRELDEFKRYLDDNFDHRHLNDVVPFPTTAENLARFLWEHCRAIWPEVVAVGVSETAKTWAVYER